MDKQNTYPVHTLLELIFTTDFHRLPVFFILVLLYGIFFLQSSYPNRILIQHKFPGVHMLVFFPPLFIASLVNINSQTLKILRYEIILILLITNALLL